MSLSSPMLHSPEQTTMTRNLSPPMTEGLAGSVAHTGEHQEAVSGGLPGVQVSLGYTVSSGHPELEQLYLQKQNKKNTEETFSIFIPCWCPTCTLKVIGQITDKHQRKGLCTVYIAINQLTFALLLQIHNSHGLNIVKASWKSDRHR